MSGFFKVEWLDTSPYLASGIMPVHVIERPPLSDEAKPWSGATERARAGVFHVPFLDVFQEDPQWAMTRDGQYVRVPVHAYKSSVRDLAALWGLGVQVGLAAMESFRCHVGRTPQAVFLVLGKACDDLAAIGENAIRAYVGVAVMSEDDR